MVKQSERLRRAGDNNRNTSENYMREDKPEAESRTHEELSQATQPMRAKPGRSFFLEVCLKKY